MGFFEFLTALVGIAFAVWVIKMAQRKKMNNRELDETESEQLDELSRLAEAMAERIKNLETILDAEQPEWRDYDEKK